MTLMKMVFSVCFAAIAIGITESLLPSNKYKAQMRLLTGSVLILSMISPVFSSFGVNPPEYPEYTTRDSAEVISSLQRAAAKGVKEQIADILRQNEINNAKITIYTDIDSDNSINITKAVIDVSKADIDKASGAAKTAQGIMKIRVEVQTDDD